MDAEDFRQYREDQQQRRKDRLPIRQLEIRALSPKFEVIELTPYQFRINGILDLYPIHKLYHNIKTGKRGKYKSAIEIVKTLTP